MRIERLPSGKYRIRKMIDRKSISVIFDHKPTQKEIDAELAKHRNRIHADKSLTFKVAAASYCDMKRNVLSPSTMKDYVRIPKRLSNRFLELKVDSITQADIQLEVNGLSKDLSPKTVRNIHGFISAVLRTFRPDMVIHTTLPQKVKYEPNLPQKSDIDMILSKVKGTKYEIPFKLGCLGLRRSEVCALKPSDLNGNTLTIDKALVEGETGLVIKTTKTTSSTREIYIPDDLAELIRKKGAIFDGYPSALLQHLTSCQDQLGIEHFRFHDLRHFYASYAHSKGMSDADIMASGGWKTDNVMKTVYRHSMQRSREDSQKRIAGSLFDANSMTNP